jgi:hypothetical protein
MFDKGQAMLLWALECQPEMAAEWNEWYNLEHLTALMQVPGFLSGNRYEQIDSSNLHPLQPRIPAPRYLSFYELYDESVLKSEAYYMNRNSLAPGMRPEWTKRMLTYITSIMGGTYFPQSDLWRNGSERSIQTLWTLYLDPLESGEEGIDQWFDDHLLPDLQKNGIVTACRLFGTQYLAPKVEGGVQQIIGPRRVVFIEVKDDFGLEKANLLQDTWSAGQDCIQNAQSVLYKRIPLSRGLDT